MSPSVPNGAVPGKPETPAATIDRAVKDAQDALKIATTACTHAGVAKATLTPEDISATTGALTTIETSLDKIVQAAGELPRVVSIRFASDVNSLATDDRANRTRRQKVRAWRGKYKAELLQLLWTSLTLGLAAWWYINGRLIQHYGVRIHHAADELWLAKCAVVSIDTFLLGLLNAVRQRCNRSEDRVWPPWIPSRGVAIIVLVLAYATLVFSFARINVAMRVLKTDVAAEPLYQAFLTVATLEHGNFDLSRPWAHATIVAEFLSVFLLFVVFFPLLIGRLAMFAGETAAAGEVYVTVKAAKGMDWQISPFAGSQPSGSDSVTLKISDKIDVTVLQLPRSPENRRDL